MNHRHYTLNGQRQQRRGNQSRSLPRRSISLLFPVCPLLPTSILPDNQQRPPEGVELQAAGAVAEAQANQRQRFANIRPGRG